MKLILGAAALAIALASTRAQEAAPSPAPAVSPLSTPPSNQPAPSPATPSTDSAKMTKEVNLAETPTAEDFSITPPPDEPDADNAPAVAGKLEGDEEAIPRPAVTGTVEVTVKNQDQTVRAAVGNLVRISLESNPSTGYNWELRDFDYGVADFYSSDLVARDNGGNVLFGAPGDTVVTIQAVKPGTQDIKLVYRRQWEPPDQVAATFGFKLEVTGDSAAVSTPSAPPAAPPTP